MRRIAALALVVAATWAVRRLGGDTTEPAGTTLAVGFALIAAALVGELFEGIRLPRITGYLVFGAACGPYLANLVTAAMARDLQLVNGLAVALIAFMAGLELNLSRLAPRLGVMLRLGLTIIVISYVGLLAVLWAAWPWLPIDPSATGATRFVQAMLLTTIVVSFSPTVTIAVIADSRARGPLSELVISVVVLADLVLILGFTVAMQIARQTIGQAAGEDVSLVAHAMWAIVGSLAAGALAGALFGLYVRQVGRELTVMLLALCVLFSIGGSAWHLEPLLAALAAGMVVENVAGAGGDAIKDAVERGSLPVLVVFFAAAGASLHLDALATVGVFALLVSMLRLGFIRGATRVGVRVSGADPAHGHLAWMGLISQAGVTLGLTMLVAGEFPAWGSALQTMVVAMIALHELVGPILFRNALVRAGEVGAMDQGGTTDEDAAVAAPTR